MANNVPLVIPFSCLGFFFFTLVLQVRFRLCLLQVPARAAAAAAVARAIAGLPPHQRHSFSSSSEELSSIYGSRPHGEVVEEIEEEFYEEVDLAHNFQFGFIIVHGLSPVTYFDK